MEKDTALKLVQIAINMIPSMDIVSPAETLNFMLLVIKDSVGRWSAMTEVNFNKKKNVHPDTIKKMDHA